MPDEPLTNAIEHGLPALKSYLKSNGQVSAQELLKAGWFAEPDIRRYLAQFAIREPIVAEEGQFQDVHAAAMTGDLDAFRSVQERSVDWSAPYWPNQGALNALEVAIKFHENAFVAALLEIGVTTESAWSSDNYPKSSLTTAIDARNYEAVHMLLKHGVKPLPSSDIPGLGFDLDVLDALIAAGLDLNSAKPGAAVGACSWAGWSRSVEERLAMFHAVVERGFKLGLEQLHSAMEEAENNAKGAEALCEGLLELGGEALATELSGEGTEELMELAWESLTAKTLARLIEVGAPFKAQRVKNSWTDADAKKQWLEQRKQVPADLPSFRELFEMADDLLVPQLVADIVIGTRKGFEMGGISLGADRETLSRLGFDLDEGSYITDSDMSAGAARNMLEIFAEDELVTGLKYSLELPDDKRPDEAFDALEARLTDRFGKKGKGRKGKKRKWENGDNTLELSRSTSAEDYPLEVTICVEVY